MIADSFTVLGFVYVIAAVFLAVVGTGAGVQLVARLRNRPRVHRTKRHGSWS